MKKMSSDYDGLETTTLSPNAFNIVDEKTARIPQSVCSLPCKIGHIMIFNTVSTALTFDKIRRHIYPRDYP